MKEKIIPMITVMVVVALSVIPIKFFLPIMLPIVGLLKAVAVIVLMLELSTVVETIYVETLLYHSHISLWKFATKKSDIVQPDFQAVTQSIAILLAGITSILVVVLL